MQNQGNSIKKSVYSNMMDKIRSNAEKRKFIREWRYGISITKNKVYSTIIPAELMKTAYGWEFKLYIPSGMQETDYFELKETIECNLRCRIMMNRPNNKCYAICSLIYDNVIEQLKSTSFIPVEVMPYELAIGLDKNGEPLIVNMNNNPNIVIAGSARTGKSGAIDGMLISLLNSCDENEVELYLMQANHTDLLKFSGYKQVKSNIYGDYDKTLSVLKHVENEMDRRLEKIAKMIKNRQGDSIIDYNELNVEAPLSYIYVVIDEFTELTQEFTDSAEQKEIKASIFKTVQRLLQVGSNVGVQLVIIGQRLVKNSYPIAASLCTNKVCFGSNSDLELEIELGKEYRNSLRGLPSRVAYYTNSKKIELIVTPNMRGRYNMFMGKDRI